MPEPITPSPAPPDVRQVLKGFAIISAFNIAGILLSEWFIPLPGAVIGLGLLAIGLFSGLIKIEWVERGASALLQSMMLFFAPALVGVLDLFPVLGSHWFAFLLAAVVSLVTVLLVTAFSATVLGRIFNPSAAHEPE